MVAWDGPRPLWGTGTGGRKRPWGCGAVGRVKQTAAKTELARLVRALPGVTQYGRLPLTGHHVSTRFLPGHSPCSAWSTPEVTVWASGWEVAEQRAVSCTWRVLAARRSLVAWLRGCIELLISV